MKKEDLIKLKQHISELSDEDKVLRDKYLWGLSTGEIEGPPVGYASIDKSWLKYYDEKDIKKYNLEMNINDFMEMYANKFGNFVALEYLGQKITFNKFKANRDKVVKALLGMGVKKGDVVSVCLPNTPEVGYIFYALMRIGAVANMLDPRTNESNLIDNVDCCNSKFLISLDSVVEKFTNTHVDNIVSVSAINSFPKIVQQFIKKSKPELDVKVPSDSRIITYDKFLSFGKRVKSPKNEKYVSNTPAVIAYTGGSTGVPKGALVTHESFNAMIIENSLVDYGVTPNDRALNIAPPWTFYGLSNCYNAYLCMGVRSILIPEIGPDDLGKAIVKYKPNHIITVPSTLVSIPKEETITDEDLRRLVTIIVGADKYDPTFEVEFADYLKQHGSNATVRKGYGMTEVCAASNFTKGETNEPGTVGIPYILENVAIFDPNDPDRELEVNAQGEIAILGPKNMVGYYGVNEKDSNLVLKKHSDGTVWAHTGDIGHIDWDGKLFVDGRLKRMFVRNGYKIFPAEVENQITKSDLVSQAAVIAIEDEINGFNTKAFIVLKDGVTLDDEEIIDNLKSFLLTKLYDYEIPDEIEMIDRMPLTLMQKIDYNALIAMEKEKKVLTLKQ